MYNIDLRPLIIAVVLVSAVVGWALIEAGLWLLSHVSISWRDFP